MAKKFIEDTELVPSGFANGISSHLASAQKIAGSQAELPRTKSKKLLRMLQKHLESF